MNFEDYENKFRGRSYSALVFTENIVKIMKNAFIYNEDYYSTRLLLKIYTRSTISGFITYAWP